jgi:large subunit ribosomal protein L29
MKNKEILELSLSELAARKHELREESFHLRMQQQSGQLEKPSQLRAIRREIARIETALTKKSNSASAAAK